MPFLKGFSHDALYSRCDPEIFDFQATADLGDSGEVLGQPRAVESVRFGIDLKDEGYNIFALCPVGVGKQCPRPGTSSRNGRTPTRIHKVFGSKRESVKRRVRCKEQR